MSAKNRNKDSFILGYMMLFVFIILVLTYLFEVRRRTVAVASNDAQDDFAEDSLNLGGDWKIIGADIQSAIAKQSLHVG